MEAQSHTEIEKLNEVINSFILYSLILGNNNFNLNL